jgi:hypothetical protein
VIGFRIVVLVCEVIVVGVGIFSTDSLGLDIFWDMKLNDSPPVFHQSLVFVLVTEVIDQAMFGMYMSKNILDPDIGVNFAHLGTDLCEECAMFKTGRHLEEIRGDIFHLGTERVGVVAGIHAAYIIGQSSFTGAHLSTDSDFHL